MKLIAKYNRVTLPITIATLLISSIAYYFIVHYVLVYQLDKDITVEKKEIIEHIMASGTLPEVSDYKDQQIRFAPLKDQQFITRFYTQTEYDPSVKEDETFRRLDFPVKVNGKFYIATVRKSQQETEDIVQLILIITFSVIVFLLLILFVANRFLLGKLWQPFYKTVEELKQFNVIGKSEIELDKTNIDEFANLNKAAIVMTRKVIADYELLKSFTENASHEIQTPLAIIQTKLEILSQSENLNKRDIQVIQSLNEAVSRLSKLNKSLLLLTKIENRQFTVLEEVNISSILLNHLENFDELTASKNISIQKKIDKEVYVRMNDSLAQILISNLIINAIKHNHNEGVIEILCENHQLSISNTGKTPEGNTAEYFQRFKKDTTLSESLGLGLSIVKKICETYDFPVSYKYGSGRHIVNIQFTGFNTV